MLPLALPLPEALPLKLPLPLALPLPLMLPDVLPDDLLLCWELLSDVVRSPWTVASPRIGPRWLTSTSLAAQPAANVASPKSAVITKRFNFTVIGIPPCEFLLRSPSMREHVACQKRHGR